MRTQQTDRLWPVVHRAADISPTVTGNANRAILKDLIQRQFDIAKVEARRSTIPARRKRAQKWDQQLTPVVDYSTPQAPPATSAAVPGMPGVSTEPGLMQQLIDSFSPAQPQAAAPAPVQAGPHLLPLRGSRCLRQHRQRRCRPTHNRCRAMRLASPPSPQDRP